MLATVLLSVLVVGIAAGMFAASRKLLPKWQVDTRGIALQTVIIMVVLLVIAGGVAAVLLNRGNEAVEQLEDADVAERVASDYSNQALCEAAGFTWGVPTADTCQ